MPLRARASADHDPTPPRPITATVAAERRDITVSWVDVSGDSILYLFAYSLGQRRYIRIKCEQSEEMHVNCLDILSTTYLPTPENRSSLSTSSVSRI